MNRKYLDLSGAVIFGVVTGYFFNSAQDKNKEIIDEMINRHVISSVGVGFKSNEPVIISPHKKDIVQSCRKIDGDGFIKGCSPGDNIEETPGFSLVDPKPDLVDLLKIVDKSTPIDNIDIEVKGKKSKARVIPMLQILHDGSYCTITYVLGRAIQRCYPF